MQKQPFTVLYPAGFLTGYATEKTAVFIYRVFYLKIYLQVPLYILFLQIYLFYIKPVIRHLTAYGIRVGIAKYL